MSEYTVREELKPSGLDGISDDQINDHWGLYKGYVTQSLSLIHISSPRDLSTSRMPSSA